MQLLRHKRKNKYFCKDFLLTLMKDFLANVWAFIRRRKYSVTIIAFLVIIVLVDENSLVRRLSQKRQINALEEEIDMYRSQLEEGQALLDNLENDSMLLERIAREKYNMSRQDEDVFIIK